MDPYPQRIEGNPTCAQLIPGSREIKIEPAPTSGETYGPVTITKVAGSVIDFTSTVPILGVVMKGSNAGNFYDYRPDGVLADQGLVTPTNASGGPAGISHISLCWIPKLVVTKTAAPTFDRDWDWTIEKSNKSYSSAADPLVLQKGQSYLVTYKVSGGATSTDQNFAVGGSITINNPSYNGAPAVITGVTDVITLSGAPDVAGTVACPVGFPHSLAAGATLTCTYSAPLNSSATRLNTATASVAPNSEVQGGSGTASVSFAGVSPKTETDKCIDISDSLVESVNKTICVSDLDASGRYQFTYQYDVKSYPDLKCDETIKIPNKASFLASNQNGESDDAGYAYSGVWVKSECLKGCTLTQGYWKTHSQAGPAPYDERWITAVTPSGSATTFFASGQTWLEVFRTQPAGNAYYNLAHQYMAAKLNILNGASAPTEVQQAISAAESFFSGRSPTAPMDATLRKQVLAWASTLDKFNNGLIGPGHCDEQSA
jgi:hypothetical protein